MTNLILTPRIRQYRKPLGYTSEMDSQFFWFFRLRLVLTVYQLTCCWQVTYFSTGAVTLWNSFSIPLSRCPIDSFHLITESQQCLFLLFIDLIPTVTASRIPYRAVGCFGLSFDFIRRYGWSEVLSSSKRYFSNYAYQLLERALSRISFFFPMFQSFAYWLCQGNSSVHFLLKASPALE